MSFVTGQVPSSRAPETGGTSASLIVREEDPLNLEMPFSSLDGFITPVERFYVRCHFPIPRIEVECAGLDANVTELILEGADQGEPEKPVRPGDPIRFARSIPVKKAPQDVLLAYRMNGCPLTMPHGFPGATEGTRPRLWQLRRAPLVTGRRRGALEQLADNMVAGFVEPSPQKSCRKPRRRAHCGLESS